ncbi:hypothetical protein Bhyg_10058 [Pseudolycoriella hygida]|uniref:Uncharacterized protein n=1 Tax=Pseudolycoriella hygida TaxID=35572 RepID=A0A9Q0MSS9_9DIPT|nr:hypothetical protein Bhyg_10058 [Pseudolycoriella hygida]
MKFALPPKRDTLKNFIIDAEMCANDFRLNLNDEQKEEIRNTAKEAIIVTKPNLKVSDDVKKLYETVDSLKNKDVYYMKADKGNSIVILDKSVYEARMQKLIDEGPYQKVRGQLTNMVSQANDALNRYEFLFGEFWKKRMKVHCPYVGALYGLPKIHKPGGGDKMRPINSNIGTPTYHLANNNRTKIDAIKQTY